MTGPRPPLDDRAVRSLTMNTQPWLSCDDCFDTVDSRIHELLTEMTAFPEAFHRHLAGCSACSEEARSLAVLVAADYALHPDVALARFEWATR